MQNDAEINVQCTPAEIGIWNGQKIYTDTGLYNTAELIELTGPLDAERFSQSLAMVYANADSLNALVRESSDAVPMRVSTDYKPIIHRRLPSDETDLEKVIEFFQEDRARDFALANEVGYRVYFLQLSSNRYVWYHCIHHLVSDGYGIHLLKQKVLQCYRGVRLEKWKFTPWRVFVDEECGYRASSRYLADEQFWRKQLAQHPLTTSYSDRNGPPSSRTHRFQQSVSLKSLEAAAALYSPANWVEILYAAVASHIACQTGNAQPVLGIPMMGRFGSCAANASGMVMNIVPLHVDLRSCRVYSDVVSVCRSSFNKIKLHGRFRYEEMRSLLANTDGFTRLFGPVVNVLPFDQNLSFDGIDVQSTTLSTGPVEDISFLFRREGTEVLLHIEANTDRYRGEEFASIATSFWEHLQMFINKDASLLLNARSLSILHGPELPEIYGTVLNKMIVVAQADPRRIAVEHEGRGYSYEQLMRAVAVLQARLVKHNIGSGCRVLLPLTRSTEAIVACLACLAQGAAFCFIDPHGPEQRSQWIAKDLQADYVMDEFSLTDLLNEQQTLAWPIDRSGRCDIAYITYTSGSTGQPKGVKVSQQALHEFMVAANSFYAVGSGDRVLQFAPLQFDASIEEIFVTLGYGATLCIRTDNCIDSVQLFNQFCCEQKISILDLPTAYWHEWVSASVRQGESLPATLRGVIIGGEAANPTVVAEWRKWSDDQPVSLWNTYGPSEATVVATVADLSVDCDVHIGRPIAGRSALVIDSRGKIVPRGQSGELLLLGSGIAEGYLNAEAQSSSFMEYVLVGRDAVPAYRTGDLVSVTEFGNLQYLGRLDNEVKISGHRINPGEVERAILLHPQIESAVVVSCALSSAHKILAGFYTSVNGLTEVDLRSFLLEQLPRVFVPTVLQKMCEFPKNGSGKIDLRALREKVTSLCENPPDENDVGDSHSLTLMSLWRKIIGPLSIDIDDNFFALGGTSLQTIQLSNLIAEQFSQPFSVADVFDFPTIRAQADRLAQRHIDDVFPDSAVHQDLHSENWRTLTHLSTEFRVQSAVSPGCDLILTGATGFLGAHLLAELLTVSVKTIVCLVRGEDAAVAKQRLMRSCEQYKVAHRIDWRRIEVCPADLALPQFGLSERAWLKLARRARCIVHNAATTSVMQDYPTLRPVNSDSTEQLIYLAGEANAKLIYISSVAVLGAMERLPNSVTNECYVPFHNGLADGYQKSKWHSEELIRQARERGLDSLTVRLGRVAPAFRQPVVNEKDLIWQVVSCGLQTGELPDLPLIEPWVAVDITSRAIACLAGRSVMPFARNTGVINLLDDNCITFSNVINALREEGYQFDVLDVESWVENTLSISHEGASNHPVAWLIRRIFLREGKSIKPNFDNQNGKTILRKIHSESVLPDLAQCIKNLQVRSILPPVTPVEEMV